MAGYAVECALKSCVLARMVHTGWVFSESVKRVDECRTHDISMLVRIAGMEEALRARLEQSSFAGDGFAANWNVTLTWKVTSRYEVRSEADARRLFEAIADETHGVLTWLRIYW